MARRKKADLSDIRRHVSLAVQRGAAKGQMTAYGKSMFALVAVGNGVEKTEIFNLPFSQRSLIGKHWNLVKTAVGAQTTAQAKAAQRALNRFVKKNPTTGGANPQEFASDVDDITNAILADPDTNISEDPYPLEPAA